MERMNHYHDRPGPHPGGDTAEYLEPDIFAGHCDVALPVISAVGAGPRGAGVIARAWSDKDTGAFGFELLDDETEEMVWRSPNMASGRLIVTQDHHNLVAGEPSVAHVHYANEGFEHVEDIVLNPGADGTRIYFRKEMIAGFDPNARHVFQDKYEALAKVEYHDQIHHMLPEPRVDDVVFGFGYNSEKCYLVIGIVEWSNVDHDATYDYDVVYVIHTAYEWMLPTVSADGNWVVGGVDTGIEAKGPKGDKGEPGHTPVLDIRGGHWTIDGQDTGMPAQGERGPAGHTPAVGSNGNWYIDGRDTGEKAVGPQGERGPAGPMPEVTIDPESGNWLVNGEDTGQSSHGEDGFAFDLQYNYYVLGRDELPDYDSVPFGYAFIVYDKDPRQGADRYDLYYKGRVPVASEDGGPWRVVEDWQGAPGTSLHLLTAGELVVQGETRITREQAGQSIVPMPKMSENDLVADHVGNIGIVSIDDETGDYVVTWAGKYDPDVSYSDLVDKPTINGQELDGDMSFADLKVSYEDLADKPSINNFTLHQGMSVSDLQIDYWELFNKPTINGIILANGTLSKALKIPWDDIVDRPTFEGQVIAGDLTKADLDLHISDIHTVGDDHILTKDNLVPTLNYWTEVTDKLSDIVEGRMLADPEFKKSMLPELPEDPKVYLDGTGEWSKVTSIEDVAITVSDEGEPGGTGSVDDGGVLHLDLTGIKGDVVEFDTLTEEQVASLKGEAGKDAGIKSVSVTVDGKHLEQPIATAEVTGETGEQEISFDFQGLAGESYYYAFSVEDGQLVLTYDETLSVEPPAYVLEGGHLYITIDGKKVDLGQVKGDVGTKILTGQGAPSETEGVRVDDLYIDTQSGKLYKYE